MKIVYYSDTKTQISHVAALIHLKKLSGDGVPAIEEIIHGLAAGKTANDGIPVDLGRDEFGNEVYTLHFGRNHGFGLQTVYFLLTAHSNPLDWKFFKVGMTMNYLIRFSTFLVHQLKLDKLEKIILAHGVQKRYRGIAAQVKQIKELSRNLG